MTFFFALLMIRKRGKTTLPLLLLMSRNEKWGGTDWTEGVKRF